MDDDEIIQIAKVLIDAHGDDAWYEAAQRADHAFEDYNEEAITNWKRVLRTIEALQNVHINTSTSMH